MAFEIKDKKSQAEIERFLQAIPYEKRIRYNYLWRFVEALKDAKVTHYVTDQDGTYVDHTFHRPEIKRYFDNPGRKGSEIKPEYYNTSFGPLVQSWFYDFQETELLFHLLKNAGIEIIVCSKSGEKAIYQTHALAQTIDLIDKIEGVEDVAVLGKKTTIGNILNSDSLRPAKVFYAEDSPSDIEAVGSDLREFAENGQLIIAEGIKSYDEALSESVSFIAVPENPDLVQRKHDYDKAKTLSGGFVGREIIERNTVILEEKHRPRQARAREKNFEEWPLAAAVAKKEEPRFEKDIYAGIGDFLQGEDDESPFASGAARQSPLIQDDSAAELNAALFQLTAAIDRLPRDSRPLMPRLYEQNLSDARCLLEKNTYIGKSVFEGLLEAAEAAKTNLYNAEKKLEDKRVKVKFLATHNAEEKKAVIASRDNLRAILQAAILVDSCLYKDSEKRIADETQAYDSSKTAATLTTLRAKLFEICYEDLTRPRRVAPLGKIYKDEDFCVAALYNMLVVKDLLNKDQIRCLQSISEDEKMPQAVRAGIEHMQALPQAKQRPASTKMSLASEPHFPEAFAAVGFSSAVERFQTKGVWHREQLPEEGPGAIFRNESPWSHEAGVGSGGFLEVAAEVGAAAAASIRRRPIPAPRPQLTAPVIPPRLSVEVVARLMGLPSEAAAEEVVAGAVASIRIRPVPRPRTGIAARPSAASPSEGSPRAAPARLSNGAGNDNVSHA